MLSYMDQMVVCKIIREKIIQAFTRSDDMGIRFRTGDIPTTESILRAVSLLPDIDTEEKLKDFITEHVLNGLRLTEEQRVRIDLND
jgi:hypothetical protein